MLEEKFIVCPKCNKLLVYVSGKTSFYREESDCEFCKRIFDLISQSKYYQKKKKKS